MADPSTDVITPTPAASPTAGIDMSNLGEAIKGIVPSSAAQINSAISTLGDAADKITGIAGGYQAQAQNIQAQQSQVFDNIKAVHTEMQASSFLPPGIKRIVGYFDHTYSDEWHKQELAKNSVALQDLQTKLNNAQLVKDSAIDATVKGASLAIQKATLSEEPLNLVSKALDSQAKLMQNDQLAKSIKLQEAPITQLTDPANPLGMPQGLIDQEIARRGARDTNLSILNMTNKSEAIRLKDMTIQDKLKNTPADQLSTAPFPAQYIAEEQARRQNLTSEEQIKEQAARSGATAIHDKALSDLAGHYTATQLAQFAGEADKAPTGKITLTTGTGEAVPVTKQEIATMLATRVKLNQAAAEDSGKISAEAAAIRGNVAIQKARLGNLDQILPPGAPPALVATVTTLGAAAEAALSQGAVGEAKKNSDAMIAAIKEETDKHVETFPKESQGYVRQVAENGEGQPGAAAPFLIQNFVTPGANVGGYYHNLSSYINNGIIDQVKGSGGGLTNGKIDVSKLLEQAMLGPVKADETIRQLAKGNVTGLDGKTEVDASGKPITINDKIVAHNFSRYLGSTMTQLASQEGSPFARYIDPQTGQYSGTLTDPSGALNTTKLMMQLQKDSIDLERQGKLRPGQNLVDTLIASLASDTNKAAWYKAIRGRMTLEDKAISAAFLKNREDWFLNGNIKDMQNRRAGVAEAGQANYEQDQRTRELGAALSQDPTVAASQTRLLGTARGKNIVDLLTDYGRP